MQLNQEFTIPIGIMCSSLFDEIKKHKKNICSIIIRYKEGIICVGRSDGMKYNPAYFNPTTMTSISPIVDGIMASNEHFITSLFEKICVDNPQRHLKSYIIHYNGRTRCVTVCKNKTGSVGMHHRTLYDQFNV